MNPAEAALADYMSELSEAANCAGWMEDLEYHLWRAVESGPFRYGRLDLTAEHTEGLRSLSESCGGWIIFADEERFIPLDRWRTMHDERNPTSLAVHRTI
jgi:hypothetical protein